MKTIRTTATSIWLYAASCLLLSGCAATAGQQFRDIMADIDTQCRNDKQGPYYESGVSSLPRQSSCDILSQKPADPLATEEGRIAYSIKLPPPHDKLNAWHSMWMDGEDYFRELCDKDAGEWIFRTVGGVEGVFQGRENMSPSRGQNLLFQNDEASEIRSNNPENFLVQPIYGLYNYVERPVDPGESGSRYMRFFRGAENRKPYPIGYTVNINGMIRYVPYIVNSAPTDKLKSRYGYTWRQIDNKDALENGIVGGETIIYDRTTNEVLAFRRFFDRYWPGPASEYTRLANHESCKTHFAEDWPDFIRKVLVPVNPEESVSARYIPHY